MTTYLATDSKKNHFDLPDGRWTVDNTSPSLTYSTEAGEEQLTEWQKRSVKHEFE